MELQKHTRDISLKFDNDVRKVDRRSQVAKLPPNNARRRVTVDYNDREHIVAKRCSGYVVDAYNG